MNLVTVFDVNDSDFPMMAFFRSLSIFDAVYPAVSLFGLKWNMCPTSFINQNKGKNKNLHQHQQTTPKIGQKHQVLRGSSIFLLQGHTVISVIFPFLYISHNETKLIVTSNRFGVVCRLSNNILFRKYLNRRPLLLSSNHQSLTYTCPFTLLSVFLRSFFSSS